MVAKGPHECEMPTELNFKHDGGQKSFACSACELILRSHTFKMMAPPLNVVHYTSTDQVSNSMLLELKRGGRKGVGKGWRLVIIKTNVCGGPYSDFYCLCCNASIGNSRQKALCFKVVHFFVCCSLTPFSSVNGGISMKLGTNIHHVCVY